MAWARGWATPARPVMWMALRTRRSALAQSTQSWGAFYRSHMQGLYASEPSLPHSSHGPQVCVGSERARARTTVGQAPMPPRHRIGPARVSAAHIGDSAPRTSSLAQSCSRDRRRTAVRARKADHSRADIPPRREGTQGAHRPASEHTPLASDTQKFTPRSPPPSAVVMVQHGQFQDQPVVCHATRSDHAGPASPDTDAPARQLAIARQ